MTDLRRFAPFSVAIAALLLFAPVAHANSNVQSCDQAPNSSLWQAYEQRFVSVDGRVIDTGNDGISHSEGQGFGLRLAFHFDARQDFARIWEWTREHLYVRGDHLAAWRWRPDADPHIDDKNNATDGDLFIAWSLALAGRCWEKPEYLDWARRIAKDIREKLVRKTTFGDLLLPGAAGFVKGERLTLNPSYWVFPALDELAALEPDAAEWSGLVTSGYALAEQLGFGRWKLVPDWVDWSPDEGFSLPAQFAPRFGYDAIRVPLYLIWHGRDADILSRLTRYWDEQASWPWQPDWTDLETDAVSSYGAPAGIAAVSGLTRFAVATIDAPETAAFLSLPAVEAGQEGAMDYYSASLSLLSRIAAETWCRQHACDSAGR
jgi:endoglucanase